MGFYNSYLKLLQNHPYKVNSLQSGILMSSGDMIAQICIEKKRQEYDAFRSIKFCSYGFIVGPTIHTWYNCLEKHLGKSNLKTGLCKLVIDQGMFAPAFLLCFMSAVAAGNGLNAQEIKQKLSQDYTDVLITNYKVWPLAQLINFFFVPLHYRVLYVQCVALGWNTYLCWKMHKVVDIKHNDY